jgi:hypothetical protein
MAVWRDGLNRVGLVGAPLFCIFLNIARHSLIFSHLHLNYDPRADI